MKRFLLVVAIILVVMIAIVGVLVGPAFIGMNPMPDEFIHNRARIVNDGFVTMGMVRVSDSQVILIDAGLDPEGTAILDALSELGLDSEAVVGILLTHGHTDHIAGATGIFPNAEVMALEAEIDLVAGRVAPGNPLGRIMPAEPTGIEVDRPLRDGETLRFGNTSVGVYAVPGHTAGSAAYLVDGVLFMGDEANAASDGTIKGPPWIFSNDKAEAEASLARLAGRLESEGAAVDVIAFAHSGPLEDGLDPLLAFAAARRSD